MAHHVVKDAVWQIVGRVVSAVGGFLVLKLITPYLWPLRFGDYSTILKYFAIWSALADFGMYVIALKKLEASLLSNTKNVVRSTVNLLARECCSLAWFTYLHICLLSWSLRILPTRICFEDCHWVWFFQRVLWLRELFRYRYNSIGKCTNSALAWR
jgi:O-antigen/teichoic acid export membrane protein